MVGRALTFTTGVPHAAPSAVYEWTIGVTDATVDEGAGLNYFIDRDRNSLEALPASFQVRFPAALVGAVDPDEAHGDSFVLNQENYLRAVSEAFNAANPNNPCQFIAAGGGTSGVYTFVMPATWNGHLDFPRLTIDNPALQGDKITGLELVSVSPGVILEAGEPVATSYVSVVIADTEVVADPLAQLVFGPNPAAQGPSVLLGAAEDTHVVYVTGVDINGAPVVLDDLVFETAGDAGGIFKIGTFVPGSGFPIEVAAVTPNFEGPNLPGFSFGASLSFYTITVRGTAGVAPAVTGQTKIRPNFPKVVATGGATPLVATDNATTLTALGGAQSNKKITFGWNGVAQRSNSQPILTGTNVTILGHPRFIGIRGTGPNVRIINGLITNLCCAAGGDLAGTARQSRDTANIGNCEHTIIRNCSFMWSIDELCSMATPNPAKQSRQVEVIYCIFMNPLARAGHSTGESVHHFGMLINQHNMGLVIHLCLFLNCRARHPDMNGPVRGAWIFNNVYMNYSLGGVTANQSSGVPGGTMITEGNLFFPQTSAQRAWAFGIYGNFSTGNFWYIPLPGEGNYVNHFIGFSNGAWNFADDPVDRRVHLNIQSGATTACFVPWRPFDEVDDYDILPTTTPAERETLFYAVLDNVGCRTLVDPDDPLSPGIPGDVNAQYETYDMLKKLRAGGPVATLTLQGSPPLLTHEIGGFTGTWPSDGTVYNPDLDSVKDKFRTPAPPHAP